MLNKNLQEAYRLIDKCFNANERDFGEGSSKELIDKAEKALGIIFPPSYRDFLEKFSCGGVGAFECDGLIDDDFINSSSPDVVWLTLQNRKKYNLPKYLIPFSPIGNGEYYAIDYSSRKNDGECSIVVLPISSNYKESFTLEVVANNFGEFFLNKVKEQIAYKNEG